MLADEVDVVIGVDTHRDTHSLAALATRTGAVLYEAAVPADAGGYRRALEQIARQAPGRRAWAVEGCGAYGAGLVRFLLGRSERAIEIDRPERRAERTQAKSDPLDAVRAARTALARTRLASPRLGSAREALRVLMVARQGAVAVRAQAIRQIKALVITAPEGLRARLRHSNGMSLLARCASLRAPKDPDPALQATVAALRALARRALSADGEAAQQRARHRRLGAGDLPPAAGRARGRADLRRPAADQLVASGPLPGRGFLRPPGRGGAHPGLVWPGRPTPP